MGNAALWQLGLARWIKIEAEASKEVEAFTADPRHDRFEDVHELMADILGAASDRGEIMSLERAYALACEIRDRQKKPTVPTPAHI